MIRRLKNLFHLFVGYAAVIFYRFPAKRLTVIGVTGTDGKTSTTHLIFHILRSCGKRVSMISSLSATIGDRVYDTGFHVTTPSAWQLQKFFRAAVSNNTDYFVVEVTSHALDQWRVVGSFIDIAVITNISHEHLDYHRSMQQYRETKTKILRGATYCVLNRDDPSFRFLRARAAGDVVSFGLHHDSDVSPRSLPLQLKLVGGFHLFNCLAASAVGLILTLDRACIQRAVSQFQGVPGRMEKVETGRSFSVYIDFAHKPNALIHALKTARKLTKNRLIVVFGCAGSRDRLKRPMMGKIAAMLADFIVLTAEDPRTEDVRDIIDQIAAGCFQGGVREKKRVKTSQSFSEGRRYFWKIPDRQEAINFAIGKLARDGDLVLVCGKGHETSMCYGRVEHPWNEKSAVQKALYATIPTPSHS